MAHVEISDNQHKNTIQKTEKHFEYFIVTAKSSQTPCEDSNEDREPETFLINSTCRVELKLCSEAENMTGADMQTPLKPSVFMDHKSPIVPAHQPGTGVDFQKFCQPVSQG